MYIFIYTDIYESIPKLYISAYYLVNNVLLTVCLVKSLLKATFKRLHNIHTLIHISHHHHNKTRGPNAHTSGIYRVMKDKSFF